MTPPPLLLFELEFELQSITTKQMIGGEIMYDHLCDNIYYSRAIGFFYYHALATAVNYDY